MKKLFVIGVIGCFILAFTWGGCQSPEGTPVPATTENKKTDTENPSYDPHRGEGKFTKVEVGATLDAAMAETGNKVFSVKCSGCHKLSEEKLVGPGWKGVTDRHSPEWIMNFMTNPDAMIDKDPNYRRNLKYAWYVCPIKI
jgi:hypothetical protein